MKEIFCECCNGDGFVLVAKLYPSGHTEVNETCPGCHGSGYIESEEIDYEIY